MSRHRDISRRRVLRGVLNGVAVGVGLPLLDCFMNGNGTALADGTQLPPCFGVWYRALGFTPGRWEPQKTGHGYEMAPDLELLAPFRDRINVYSGLRCFLDGNSNQPHISGTQIMLYGGVSAKGGPDSGANDPSIDQLIADVIGARTRFRSLEVSCDGTLASYSRRNASTINPAETSPAALYTRVFGPDFKDPNAAQFTPDAGVLARRSVLSAVAEQSRSFTRQLGASDRTRLDDYFTSLRELEKKLDIELQKPAPLEACSAPERPPETGSGTVLDDVVVNHTLFAGLLAHALACGQTQVINVLFENGALRKAGSGDTYHTHTHEEATDPALGCQPNVTWFQNESLKALVTLLKTLDGIREGERTLLDRTLLLHATDVAFGRTHGLENFPLLTIGGASGRIKTGIHVAAQGEAVARVGLTIQQAFGVSTGAWGRESNRTSKAITEVMA